MYGKTHKLLSCRSATKKLLKHLHAKKKVFLCSFLFLFFLCVSQAMDVFLLLIIINLQIKSVCVCLCDHPQTQQQKSIKYKQNTKQNLCAQDIKSNLLN